MLYCSTSKNNSRKSNHPLAKMIKDLKEREDLKAGLKTEFHILPITILISIFGRPFLYTTNCFIKNREMSQDLHEDKKVSYSELFTEYLSDITLEIEGMKISALRNDIDRIKVHIERINNAVLAIMDTKLDMAERFYSQLVPNPVHFK